MTAQKNISNLLFVVLACFVIIGCKPKSQALPSEDSRSVQKQQESSDKINLLDLPGDSKIIPLENPKSGVIAGSSILKDVEPEHVDSAYQHIENIPDEIDSLNSQAYRVQIFSSKKFGESRHAKIVAEEIFDRPVFLDYEVPYYKIRVGNFSNREKAEEYQQRVKSSGYKNAWVVVVTVNVKEISPMYDEMIIPEIIDSLYLQDETKNKDESNDSE